MPRGLYEKNNNKYNKKYIFNTNAFNFNSRDIKWIKK